MNDEPDLRAVASAAAPEDAGDVGTVLAADEHTALETVSAYFGSADEREAVRVVVGGENLGYVDRDQALALLDVQSRDIGHSAGWGLQGVPGYNPIELRCPAEDCPANPIYADSFDEAYPPDCPKHPGVALMLA